MSRIRYYKLISPMCNLTTTDQNDVTRVVKKNFPEFLSFNELTKWFDNRKNNTFRFQGTREQNSFRVERHIKESTQRREQ